MMSMSEDVFQQGIVLVILLVGTALLLKYCFISPEQNPEPAGATDRKASDASEESKPRKEKHKPQQQGKSMTKLLKQANKHMTAKEEAPDHPLFSRIFRAGKSSITAFAISPHGKFIALATHDSTIQIILIDRPKDASGNFPSFRVSLELDFASALAFSDDEKLLCVATYTDRKLLVYHVPSKKAQGKAPELKSSFETSHKAVITDLSVSAFPALPASIFIVTSCRTKEDTHVFCWSPKSGECLARVDTAQVENHRSVVSPSGQLLAVPAWTNELKVWRCEQKEGALHCLKKLFTLQGHKKSVADVCFVPHDKRLGGNALERLIITADSDGVCKLWDINVRIDVNEDPRLVDTFTLGASATIKQIVLFPESAKSAKDGNLNQLKLAIVDENVVKVVQLSIKHPNLQPTTPIESSMVTWTRMKELDLKEYGNLREVAMLESGQELATLFENSRALKLWKPPC